MTAKDSRWFATRISGSGLPPPNPMGTWTGSSGRSGSRPRIRSRRWPQETPISRSTAADSDQLDRLFVRFAAQVHRLRAHRRSSSCSTPESPPFDDPQVRRAVNLVIDRDRVVQILGERSRSGQRASSSLRTSPGTNRTARSRRTRAGEERASGPPRAWTSRKPERSFAVPARPGCASCSSTSPSIWPQGADSGGVPDRSAREARLPRHRAAPSHSKPSTIPRMSSRWRSRHGAPTIRQPRASSTISSRATLLSPRGRDSATAQIDEMIERGDSGCRSTTPSRPARSGRRSIERSSTRLRTSGSTNPNTIGFVSERVGNYQFSLQWGILLNQLWVR